MSVKAIVSIAILAQIALTTKPIANSLLSSLLLYKRLRGYGIYFKNHAKLTFA